MDALLDGAEREHASPTSRSSHRWSSWLLALAIVASVAFGWFVLA